jgi:geranylgeranyl diphosphate synthase type II
MNLLDRLAQDRKRVDGRLDELLPLEETPPSVLHKAMRYAVFAGGKRIRPCLVILGAEAVGGDGGGVLAAAAAIECVHTYSLIHDDLPAMDDDDVRRGKPSLHKAFGEATAILAGDALLTLAFELMLSPEWARIHPASRVIGVAAELARAAGSRGLVGGQVEDMLQEGRPVTRPAVEYIVRNKTGALIASSLRVGAMLAGADDDRLAAITRCGENLGAVFQIRDDLLDLEGDSATLGKAARKDERRGKATFPRLLGTRESRDLMRRLAQEAKDALTPFGSRAEYLTSLADYLVERTS